jgi:hypothetical protein
MRANPGLLGGGAAGEPEAGGAAVNQVKGGAISRYVSSVKPLPSAGLFGHQREVSACLGNAQAMYQVVHLGRYAS